MPKVAADPAGGSKAHLVWAALLLIPGLGLLPPASPTIPAVLWNQGARFPSSREPCILIQHKECAPSPVLGPCYAGHSWEGHKPGRPQPQGAPGLDGESQTEIENLPGSSKAHEVFPQPPATLPGTQRALGKG